MDSNNSKISFIPKESLVRDESFLERRRPRSAMKFIASLVFISSVSAYAALYYYNNTLNQTIADRITEIENLQREFTDTPEVREAKVFSARANLARELLSSHTVVSPIFGFLSKNTVGTILYDKFSFDNGEKGAVVGLHGEAPNYASLAYQADVFRKQTKALASFTVNDVALTERGTVSFSFIMIFNPDFVSYLKYERSAESGATQGQVETFISAPFSADTASLFVLGIPTQGVSTTSYSTTLGNTDVYSDAQRANITEDPAVTTLNVPSDIPIVATESNATRETTLTREKQSFLSSIWEKFKFW